MLSNELQPSKAKSPMAVTDWGIVMLSKELQPSKALFEMNVNDSGRVMLAKELHPAKAPNPMAVTDSGIAMLARDAQCRKAQSSMAVTDSGIVMSAKELHPSKARPPITVTDSGKVMSAKEVHPSKARPPMAVTDSGRLMLAKDLQFAKAPSPMAVTDSGIVMPCQRTATAKGIASNGRDRRWDCHLDHPIVQFKGSLRYLCEGGWDVDLKEALLHGLLPLLQLQLRFCRKLQSLQNPHATAPQTPVSDHHLLTIHRPGLLLWGFDAQSDLDNVSFHEALPLILQWCLLAWLQGWGHHPLRLSLSVLFATWRPWRPTVHCFPATNLEVPEVPEVLWDL